jgi:hypothetical protein
MRDIFVELVNNPAHKFNCLSGIVHFSASTDSYTRCKRFHILSRLGYNYINETARVVVL